MKRLLFILLLSFAGTPLAQPFPAKPVHLVVPNPPGGSIDILARVFSQALQQIWGGQSVIVEYKPGGGTVVGTDFVAKSAPDGHTLGFVVTAHVINPSVRASMPFDTVKDLSGITLIGVSDVLISATPGLPASTLQELIALAKKQPGKLNYASPGSASAMHLAGELLKQQAGIDIVHIPFKGNAPAFPEVFAGRVELLIDPLFSSMPHVKAGRLKPLAVTGARRSPAAPDIPAAGELFPGYNVQSLNGVVVPSATPRALVQRLNADFLKAMQLPEMRKRMAEFGLQPVGNSPDEFDKLILAELDKWARVTKAANIKVD
jgi:tripartite-type tricarboxylate transporter receptor subunit TctC